MLAVSNFLCMHLLGVRSPLLSLSLFLSRPLPTCFTHDLENSPASLPSTHCRLPAVSLSVCNTLLRLYSGPKILLPPTHPTKHPSTDNNTQLDKTRPDSTVWTGLDQLQVPYLAFTCTPSLLFASLLTRLGTSHLPNTDNLPCCLGPCYFGPLYYHKHSHAHHRRPPTTHTNLLLPLQTASLPAKA